MARLLRRSTSLPCSFATRVAPTGPGSAYVRMCRSDASRERTGQWRLSRPCSSSGHGPDGGEAGIRASRIALRSIGPWNYCNGGAGACKRAAGFGSRLASLLQALVRRVYGCVGATQVANQRGRDVPRHGMPGVGPRTGKRCRAPNRRALLQQARSHVGATQVANERGRDIPRHGMPGVGPRTGTRCRAPNGRALVRRVHGCVGATQVANERGRDVPRHGMPRVSSHAGTWRGARRRRRTARRSRDGPTAGDADRARRRAGARPAACRCPSRRCPRPPW